MSEPKYPSINIKLVGEDGNAFSILARVNEAVRESDEDVDISAFRKEAMSGNYSHLLCTVMNWFSVDADEAQEDDEFETCDYCGCLLNEFGDCPNCDDDEEDDWEDEEDYE